MDNKEIDFKNVEEVLGRDGSYSKTIENYEFRKEQIELSGAITNALNERKILLAEAGTGVGKSMAYLVPAVMYAKFNGPVIISTNTINLQSQLLTKDVPDVALSMPYEEFKTMLVKGRNNYVCLSMIDDAHNNMLINGTPEFEKLKKWVKKTKTGELQDLTFAFPEWSEVASNSHTCKRNECPYKQKGMCFYYRMQEKVKYADVIITNHSLFFSDLIAKSTDPYAGILPESYSAVIFDEAHHLEDTASKTFGTEFNSFQIPLLVKRIKNRNDIKVENSLLKELSKLNDDLFGPVTKNCSNDYFLHEAYEAVGEENIKQTALKIKNVLNAVLEDLDKSKKDAEKETKSVIDRYSDIVMEILTGVGNVFFEEDEEFFKWGETRPNDKYAACTFHSTPINVAELLNDYLFSLGLPVIMTSATLSTGKGAFDYIKKRLGIEDEDVETLDVGAPFDYMSNLYLYVPDDIPAPNNGPEYINKISDIIMQLVDYAKGNAFVLFTSYRMMRDVYDNLAINMKYEILKQGDMSNEELLKTFKKNENTVLFGTSAFWEGVDVKGDKLSLVIIDKIPFPVPSSPLVKSKCDFIDSNNGNSFVEYSIPSACIKLKQGFGRLIRTKTDKGVVAVLDSRIHTKFYRKQILNAIPKCKGTKKLEKVKEFFENMG